VQALRIGAGEAYWPVWGLSNHPTRRSDRHDKSFARPARRSSPPRLRAGLLVIRLDDVKRVAEITSHADRARAASELLTELQASVTEAARLRRESIAWLREHGYSLAAIADIIGVSRARIAQLREAGPPPERVFLGTDRLTVAIPLKTEATSGRPVVAQEDFAAFNLLADLARDLQLDATAEYIPIGGDLDLNRDNLIVICGPRLSPVIREVLHSDPALGFDQDDAGRWLLQDRHTDERYPSPSDLPQPDLPTLATSPGCVVRMATAPSSCSPGSTRPDPTASSTSCGANSPTSTSRSTCSRSPP
jgi:hypothetical protein